MINIESKYRNKIKPTLLGWEDATLGSFGSPPSPPHYTEQN